MSPEVQNRGISGSTKKDLSPTKKNFFLKLPLTCFSLIICLEFRQQKFDLISELKTWKLMLRWFCAETAKKLVLSDREEKRSWSLENKDDCRSMRKKLQMLVNFSELYWNFKILFILHEKYFSTYLPATKTIFGTRLCFHKCLSLCLAAWSHVPSEGAAYRKGFCQQGLAYRGGWADPPSPTNQKSGWYASYWNALLFTTYFIAFRVPCLCVVL